MPKDIQVVISIDAKPRASEALDILLVSTAGQRDMAVYRDIDAVEAAFTKDSVVYKKVCALFNQGKTTLADSLFRKVRIVGMEPPAGDTDAEKAKDLVDKIDALRAVDDDWYILMTDVSGGAYAKALCAWAEKTEPTEAELGAGIEDYRKMYFGQTDEKDLVIPNRRCVLVYTDDLQEQADAAYLGNVGPFYPRSVTWKFKRPEGLALPDLTDGERDALEEAHINFLTAEYKNEYVKNGTCCDGEFIDVQMGADYVAKYMRTELYNVFLTNAKVPYTDMGFAIVADAVFRTLNRAVDLGIIARDAESGNGVYTVHVPKRYEATEDEARERRMPDIVWEALLEGAVHSVKVRGTLRAQLNAA